MPRQVAGLLCRAEPVLPVDCGARLDGRVAGVDDPGFVGEYHGLGAVSRTDFGEEVPDVCAHRRLAQVQPSGDLGVGQAAGKEDEHLALPVGHPVQARDELEGWSSLR